MNTTNTITPAVTTASTHPLILLAAGSVTVLSLAGVATMAGWLPGSRAATERIEPAQAVAAPATLPAQPSIAVPQEKEKVAVKPVERTSAPVARNASKPRTETAAIAVSPAPTFAGSTSSQTNQPAPPTICRDCGVVNSVREIKVEGKGTGIGAVAGGVVGAVIGHQIGSGGGRDLTRILGAAGGAYAGNEIEKSTKESKRYEVTVRLEDGTTRKFNSETPPEWQSGDRVKIQNGVLTSRGATPALI